MGDYQGSDDFSFLNNARSKSRDSRIERGRGGQGVGASPWVGVSFVAEA